MDDELDLRVIERSHDADVTYRGDLRRRLATILEGTDAPTPRTTTDDDPVAIDLVAHRPTRPERRRWWVIGVAALVGAAAAIAAIVVVLSRDTAVAPTVHLVPPPPDTSPAPSPATTLPTSGGMWPQATLEDVRAAQALADGGDPTYAWQLVAREPADPGTHVDFQIVDRFLRDVLGWQAYLYNGVDGGDGDGWEDGDLLDQRYIRCVPGATNPLYPPHDDAAPTGEACAPTIDDLHYESVSLNLAQLDRHGPEGLWVISNWHLTSPFAQADPAAVEAEASGLLDEFLAARLAGTGADGLLQVAGYDDVPLLYSTTAGHPYERYDVERLDGPQWPLGWMHFSVRLFADGGATVVEQEIMWSPGPDSWLDANSTTENGQPVDLAYSSPDGSVTISAPSSWTLFWSGPTAAGVGLNTWFGLMSPKSRSSWESHESIGVIDPVAYDAWCAANGGSPLLTAPADAAAIAQQVLADPNFEATDPVPTQIGGVDAIWMDVALAPGGTDCGIGIIEVSRWIHELSPGLRIRLFLVDLPEGMSTKTLAITIAAPEERFAALVAETEPIIDSIQFHQG